MSDRFDEEALAIYEATEGFSETVLRSIASALRPTHEKADREARIDELERLLTWGTANITHPLREHIQKRLAELRKGIK